MGRVLWNALNKRKSATASAKARALAEELADVPGDARKIGKRPKAKAAPKTTGAKAGAKAGVVKAKAKFLTEHYAKHDLRDGSVQSSNRNSCVARSVVALDAYTRVAAQMLLSIHIACLFGGTAKLGAYDSARCAW